MPSAPTTEPTPVIDIEVRPADPSEAEAITLLLVKAAKWLEGRGIQQWRPDWFTVEDTAAAIGMGEMYAACEGDEVVGAFRLQWADSFFWGADEGQDGSAGYVHRLVVRRSHAGKGLGLRLLEEAEACSVAAGKEFLRLDCGAGNEALCAYYRQAGFTLRRCVDLRGWQGALFEKQVGSTLR